MTTASRQGSVHIIEGTEPEPWTREVAFEELQKKTWQVTRSTSMSALDDETEEAEDVLVSPGVQRKRPEDPDVEGKMGKVAGRAAKATLYKFTPRHGGADQQNVCGGGD